MNGGVATARDFHAHIEISQNTIQENKRVILLKSDEVERPEIRGKPDVFIYTTHVNVNWAPLYRRTEVLVVSGTMDYDNGFDRKVKGLPFCGIIYVQPTIPAVPIMSIPARPANLVSQACDYLPKLRTP